jgi:predicted nucleic acid-binding protein
LLLQQWRGGGYTLVISEHILQELERTLSEDRYFAARSTPSAVRAILARLRAAASITELTVEVRGVATHPEDDLDLSTALSGQTSMLCTRDKQLLRLRSCQMVAILSPGELLALLEGEAPT